MPSAAENYVAANFFLPEFLQQFLPDRKSIETFLDCRYFTRERRLTLEITLALMLNMVRPGERLGYQKVIDRFFSGTGILFDVLAKLPLNYLRAPFNTPEREMALELIRELGPGDLLLLDRGYPGYEMFLALIEQHIDFLIRLPKNGMFKEVRDFLARGKRDGKVTIPTPRNLVKDHPDANFQPLTLRVVVVSLPGSQEKAIFITTLLERPKYPPRALRNLYHLRWQEEEFFKTIKEHLRAEEFRGKSVQFIDQELLSTYLYYLLTRIMMLEAARQQELPVADLETKAALVAAARYLDRLLLAETLEQCQELTRYCLAEITWRQYRCRPGRKFPRKSKSRHGKWATNWA